MKLGFLTIAVFAGVLNPFLGGMNATLGRALSQPVWAVAATFAVAMSATLAAALATGQRFPDAASIMPPASRRRHGGAGSAGCSPQASCCR